MKLVYKLKSREEMLKDIQDSIDRVTAYFKKENHREPVKGEMVFYCPSCWWWTADLNLAVATEREYPVRDEKGYIIIGKYRLKTILVCAECGELLKSTSIQRYTTNAPAWMMSRRADRRVQVARR